MSDHRKINRTRTLPSGRILLRIDEVDELLVAVSELTSAYRRGGATQARIAHAEDLALRLRGLFGDDEWEQFSQQRWSPSA